MPIPADFHYSKEHTWVRQTNDAEATIGITGFAQEQLGEIVYADLPAKGATFKKDEVFGSIEALKTTSDLFMPVSGEIIEVNGRLKSEPELVNNDPFGEGWLVKIKLLNAEELGTILTAGDYEKLTN